jgi:preprotein translocase subunit SecA
MLSIFKKFFGDKASRDLKEVMPLVNAIKVAYEPIKLLSNDLLRAKTAEFKNKIAETVKEEVSTIAESQKKSRIL